MTVDVYMLPGSGHPNGGDGVVEDFFNHLDAAKFTTHIVPYPAAVGGPDMPYADSVAAGRQALIDAVSATSNLVIIGGYSQGAGIAGDLAAEIGAGQHPDLKILGCAMIADPLRPTGVGMPGQPVTGGYGICGERVIPSSVPQWWAAHPGDPITALPAGNPLRTIADIAAWYSLRSPVDMYRWALDLVDRARTGRWQAWWDVANWASWSGAVGFAANYLAWGYHGAHYVIDGLTAQLAEVVNRQVP